ncbi:MAG: hypothetical protein Q9226_008984, partial [Calogaya cf. arnoldii]
MHKLIGPTFTYTYPSHLGLHDTTAQERYAVLAEADKMPKAHCDPLALLTCVFRQQVHDAKHPGFKKEIDKLEDKVLAWLRELRNIDE